MEFPPLGLLKTHLLAGPPQCYHDTLNRKPGFRFRICHQNRYRKYGSAILSVSGSALRPLQQNPHFVGEWRSGCIRHLSVCHLAENLYDHTYKGAVERHVTNLEPEIEFRRQGALFRIQLWGHISATDQDIFTTFGA